MADMTVGSPGFARIAIGPMSGKSIQITGTPGIITLCVVKGEHDVYVKQGDTMARAGDSSSIRIKPRETVRWDNTQGNDVLTFQFYCDGAAVVQLASGALIM